MAQLLDQELVERAGARVASSARAEDAKTETAAREPEAERSLADRLSRDVWQIAAKALRMPEEQLDPQENLANLGVDSIAITEIMVQISRHFAISVAPTTFFEARHLDDLSNILLERYAKPIEAHYAKEEAAKEPQPDPVRIEAPVAQDAPPANADDGTFEESWLRRHRAFAPKPAKTAAPRVRLEPPMRPALEAPIAILSIEGMFPKSPDLETFAAHLAAGDDCIEEIPPDRWDWRAVYGDPKKGPYTDVKYGGFVPGADLFDAGFFNISPREAELMDPQHRLFMECVWSLIEKGGYAPGALAGRKVSLFLGINLLDYTNMVNAAGLMEVQQLTGLGHSFCPNRLSFLLDIHGPSEVVDTACSSSLVAIHRAVMSIRHEGCEMAIAAGSNLMLSPMQHIMYSKVGMIAPDGRCKSFSRDANGYARSDGVGAVLLKRLDLAERDGDPILGVIRGSVEHHGGGATSLTAPNPKAQAALIVEAHRQAGVDPRSIGMIECHGTGTSLGDPIEAKGLKLAFRKLYEDWGFQSPDRAVTGIGSVKSNIGHTETAAGIAGLIKVLLAMKSRTLYRSLHGAEPNPLLELSGSPFYLLQAAAPWDRPVIDGEELPRRAGLSSFGAGGTNAHLVIEEYIPHDAARSAVCQGPVVVPISAKTAEALTAAVAQLRDAAKEAYFSDLAYTLQIARDAMRHRVTFVAEGRDDLLGQMEGYLAGDRDVAVSGIVRNGHKEKAETLDPRGKEAPEIARHWASGGDVDWSALYGESYPRRIALPAYPFQRKRYWLPEVETATAAPHATLSPVSEGAGKYALSVTGTEPFLADHKVTGVPVLPGVAYLELARAAAVKEGIANPVLRQVIWMAPCKVESPTRIACEITRAADGSARAEISSQSEDGERLVHAQMKIADEPASPSRSLDLEALRNHESRHFNRVEIYAAFDRMGLIYGPNHRVVADLAVSADPTGAARVLTRLELSEAQTSTLADFVLHPGLMDGALQSAVGLALDASGDAPKTAALPFSIDAVEILGSLEPHMWADIRVAEKTGSSLMRMDIDLIGEDGTVRVAIRGFTTRALQRPDETDALRFEPHWHPFESAATSEPSSRRIVLLTAGAGEASALKSAFPDAEIRTLDDDRNAPLDRRFHRLADQLLKTGQAALSGDPVLIQLVLADDAESVPLSALSSMFRTMRREHPKLSGQVLLVPEATDDLAALLHKAETAPAGACLEVDGDTLAMETWDEVPLPAEPANLPWYAGGVYLITGGTGTLGQALAREILETAPGAVVVPASRSAPDAATAQWIAATPDLHHLRADFSVETSVTELIRVIRETHGRLDGVIHTAGVIHDEAFARKTPDQLAAAFGPKVTGAVALDKAIGAAPLDFLVFYSSISGVVGNIGQVDYAAANGFLDAFAESREVRRRAGACHGRTRSIAWPLWRDGGMMLDSAQEDLMRRTTGLAPMETRDGIDALCAAVAGDASRVCIAPGDAARIRRFVGRTFEPKTTPAQPAAPARTGPASRKSSDSAHLRRLVLASLTEEASEQLKVSPDDLDPDEELTEYGFDSIGFTQFANRLNDCFDLELTPTLFFEYPTLDGLAGYLADQESTAMAAALGVAGAVEGEPAPEPEFAPEPTSARPTIAPEPERHPAPSTGTDGLIAIIGMSGQFPGAPDVDAFWQVLKEGRDCIGEIPGERWDWRDYWGDPLSEPGKGNVKWGGFIEDMAAFDAPFFGISAPEARMMDPQQRLLLTASWRVMEDAGYAPSALAGSKTGVFIGTADTGYSRLISQGGVAVEGYSMTGLAPSLGPNRISYVYDFHGPSVAVETACSSALIAVHRAVEAIRAGHCTAAIAGGINALLLPDAFVGFAKAGMLSPEGRCKTFSATADGYARGEGVGLVFLKPLREAERDGDRILGVIRASAENHGGHAASLTAPNSKAQADLLRTAYARSGIDPRTVGYIEAHGTGTPLGDPIEVEALTSAFSDLACEAEITFGPAPEQACAIGSVKSNIGHLELAAGIAGLIKVLLQMRHGKIARSLHAEDLNPYMKLKGSPFHVAQTAERWSRVCDADGNRLPRRAGVSSFGFGGTNAHVVLEEYCAPDSAVPDAADDDPELIVLSARSDAQLTETVRRLADFVSGEGQAAELRDIAHTLQITRDPMEFRLAFAAGSMAEMLERLNAYLAGEEGDALHTGRVKANRKTNAVLESDGPLREAAAGLAERGRGEDLLTLWVGGFGIDWATVRKGRPGKRIPLPGYPFAKTHYWVGQGPNALIMPATTPAVSSREAAAPISEAPVPQVREITPADRLERTLAVVAEIAARTLEVDPSILDVDTELGDFGFDSITMTTFAAEINAGLGLALTPADFFEFATLFRLASHIAPNLSAAQLGLEVKPISPSVAPPAVGSAKVASPDPQSRTSVPDDDPVVIVGQSCRFPMALDGNEFWSNLISARDCIIRIPADRWSWQALDGDPRREPTKTNIHWGGFIDGVFEFDPLFFGISPREARLMDPQQRLMLVHAWKAVEDAGHSPESLAGQKVGVFVGTSSSGYREMIGADSGGEGYVATGAVPSVGPNRISYLLDLHGPSEPVETACSSSLVALHRAVQAIRAGDCDMALVGGVNTIITPEAHINFAKAGMLSPDGRCKTFSAEANGYVRGEGVGMLFVRRLSDAERDGDPILAIVRGTAINHGGHANSLTAPNTSAQADLLIFAYTNAGIDPRTVGYIEAHGTGTALGDPVEINALKSAFRALPTMPGSPDSASCALASIKTNIGHLELAAGVAGVIKVLKQFEHRRLAPNLHCETINPYIDLSDSPFRILHAAEPWEPVRNEHGKALPLRAGISSFGFGGVNAHVILEEYCPAEDRTSDQSAPSGPVVVPLSARDGDRLKDCARNLLAELDSGRLAEADLPDLAHTLQVGRSELAERLAVVADSLEDLHASLESFLEGREASAIFTGRVGKPDPAAGDLPPDAEAADIARHWTGGGKVDWQAQNPGPHRRLHLPTYPFARDVYRAGPVPGSQPDEGFRFRLSADAFYLRDHVVRGNRILPGAMSLEIVCKAALEEKVATSLPVILSGVTWHRPVELNSGEIELDVVFDEAVRGGRRFRLVPRGDDRSDFVRGMIELADGTDRPASLDIAALQRAYPVLHDRDWLYATYSALGIDYGPAMRAVAELSSSGDGGALARLRLPQAATETSEGFILHPSLLDAAFQSALVAFSSEGDGVLALPFGIDRVEVCAPTANTVWAHLRLRPQGEAVRKLDIDLADEDGRLSARIEGFSVRLLPDEGPRKEPPEAEAAPPRTVDASAVERYFVDLIARETEVDAASVLLSAPLEVYGIDSVLIMQLMDVLERDFGPLPKTLFFEYQTLEALIGYFREKHRVRLAEITGAARQAPEMPARKTSDAVKRGPVAANEPIAIIGLAGRYPGARTLDQFWENLASGRGSVTEVPPTRWDHARHYDPERKIGKTTCKYGGFIEGHDRFDPMFFNIAPREAQYLDPQERLFLQTAWETLEDAGYTREAVASNGARHGGAGVYVGVMWEEYQLYAAEMNARGIPAAIAGSAAAIANRVSYFLNFHGPSIALDTMCSSSLTAIHLACEALRSGDCSVALAGGVNLTPHPNKYFALSQGRFLSARGHCAAFGAEGDGYVPAEGVGAVLLKPLAQAEADGDRIYGVILGSALNHGGKTNGFTVPNPVSQTAVIERALDKAGVAPGEVSYIEAHGTGTNLGDPIEIAALTKAFAGAGGQPCAIGSVKSNIGHAESAAGMAGLTKLLLQLKHGQLAPSIHAEELNPNIDFEGSPFRVQRVLAPWQKSMDNGKALPRIAGLSSFGAGGANAHLIIAEHLEAPRPFLPVAPRVYPFSARDPDRLEVLLRQVRSHLDTLSESDLPSITYTLQEGREAFEERLAIVAQSMGDLKRGLDRVLAGETSEHVFRARASAQATTIAASSELSDIAAGWVNGARVDWRALREDEKPRPISLPTYPFAEDHCWLPVVDGAETPAAVETRLPLLFALDRRDRLAETTGQLPTNPPLHVLCDLPSAYAGLADALREMGAEVVVPDLPETSALDARYGALALSLLDCLKEQARARQERVVQVVVPLAGDDSLFEGLSGLLRCAALEHPILTCRLIAVDRAVPDLAGRLAEDAECGKDQAEIRYREGRRLVRTWRELAPTSAQTAAPWVENGVYLLTGGAGGIGLHVAEDIAASGTRPSLWLTGRSSPTPAIEQSLKKLEAFGASARYRRVDVTDAAAVSALLDEIERTDGHLTGIFHGAGLTRDGLLLAKTDETFNEVLAPKVTGACILDEALGDRPLDFLVLFASAAGALGNPGQSDYAAANAFLDAFAARRNAQVAAGTRAGRTVSIDWPYWRDGGMTMDERTISAIRRTSGVLPLETATGLAALKTILGSSEEAQVLVLEGDHGRLRGLMKPADAPAQPMAAATQAAPVKRSEPVPASATRKETVAAIKAAFSTCLGIPEDRLGPDDTIDRFGVDSVSGLEVVEVLEASFGSLPQTILFEFQTINRLADELTDKFATVENDETSPPLAEPVARTEPAPEPDERDIAIIAVAGRFPGADTIEDFADLLREGRDCVTEIPADRQDLVPRYSPRRGEPGASYCKWGAFLSDVDCFDAGFFGFTPRDADLSDPQERLFLQTTWHLFERVGHTRPYLAEHYDKRVGVFVGTMYNQYPGLATELETRALLALSSYSGIANRTSFFFDLQGPSVALDSMCSSGLQAVHQACQSLRLGECRLAVAGGVNLSIHPGKYEALSRAGLVAGNPDARAFSGGAGYLPAEGVGAVLLKPQADAMVDGDRILAVIKGNLANHAGHSAGYAVPNVDAQVHLLEDAFERAGIDPATIGYVEVAATGSQIGDAIELRSLTEAFSKAEGARPAIGSVKTNMGHAEGASGLAQLAKVLLQFEHRELFPSFVKNGAPEAFRGTVFRPQTELAPWPAPVGPNGQEPRRATISSFGAGGSNVHLILEEAPKVETSKASPEAVKSRLFPVSARTEDQLVDLRAALVRHLRANQDLSLAALSRTLRLGRESFDCKVTFVASSTEDLIRKLEDPAFVEPVEAIAALSPQDDERSGPMLVLPGYPFKRERHWLKTVPVVAPSEEIEDVAPEAGDKESALDFIRRILAAELGCPVDDIPADADFESLGVDSMARMRLVYSIEDAYGAALTQADMEAHPTPQSLAARLESLGASVAPAVFAPQARETPSRRPLGEAQKGLWVLQSLYPQSGDYNVPMAYLCRSLDRASLAKAVDWLTGEYPILATRFEEEAGEPVLVPRPDVVEINSVALPKELESEAFLRRRAAIPFDLSKGVFRIDLVFGGRLEPDTSVVLLTAHHIVTDGVSSAVMSRDLWQAYERFARGEPAPRGHGDAADYADFVAWEEQVTTSDEGDAQKSYWLEKLRDPLPDLRLPTISGATRKTITAGENLDLKLSRDLTARFCETAKALGISQAALYLSAFSGLLYRYTGERDLVIGIPTLRRPARRFAETLGFCANMVALRLALEPNLSLSDWAARVHVDLAEGLAHSDYPFARIARELGGTASGDSPYQVTFAYQSFGAELTGLSSVASGDIRLLPSIRQAGDTEFGIEVQNAPDGALVITNFDANSFARGTMERMLHHYRLLLEALAKGQAEPLFSVPMLTKSETDRALHHWSRTRDVETSATLAHDLVFDRARKTPGAVAVSAEAGRLSYKRLAVRTRRIALSLQRHGVKHGDRVAVLLGREPDAIAALLAVLASGAVWVPLDPEFPDERLTHILSDAGASFVLTKGANAARLQGLADVPVIDLDRENVGLFDRFARLPTVEIGPDDPAYIIYTSGSTGMPKGVVISHEALSRHCQIVAREYGLSVDDVVLQFASASVDTALEQILPVLTVGGSLELRPEGLQTPEAFHAWLADKAITVADLPPVYLHELLRAWQSREAALPALPLRLVIVGGEALSREVVDLWGRSAFARIRLVNAYGPTEATITALTHDVKPNKATDAVPIGRPLPGVEIYILDGDGNLVPDGIVGELYLGGDRLAPGYHGRPDLTAAKFCTHRIADRDIRLYATGDLACFRPNSGGQVEFHGRIDDQVKIRGYRIELGEVEAALGACGVGEAAVLVERNRVGDPVLTAFLGGMDGSLGDLDLKEQLAHSLPAHMVPSVWVRLDRLPKTVSGKIDRIALRRHETGDAQEAQSARPPRDGLERMLRQIWGAVLGREEAGLGIDDDFAQAGGHSLLTVRLLSRIQQAFGCALSVSDLSGAATIAAQGRLLRARGVSGAGAETKTPDEIPLVVSLRQPDRASGERVAPPLFLIHPIGGTLTCYRPLLDALPVDIPVYGVRAEGLEPGEGVRTDRIEAMAARYCGQIRKLQGHGPYRLAGWSLGGAIAFEMARHLEAAGEAVSFLGLIDSYTPADIRELEASSEAGDDDIDLRCRQAFVRDLFGAEMVLAPDQDVVEVVRSLPQFQVAFPGAGEEDVRCLLAVFSANFALLRAYEPQACSAPLTLVRALGGLKRDFTESWAALTCVTPKVCRVEADHYSVLRAPALDAWVPEICESLTGDPQLVRTGSV